MWSVSKEDMGSLWEEGHMMREAEDRAMKAKEDPGPQETGRSRKDPSPETLEGAPPYDTTIVDF